MRVGQSVHQGLEVSSAGGHPAWEGAQPWCPLSGEPSALTRKDVVTWRELPWKRAATQARAAGSARALHEWHGSEDNSSVRCEQLDNLLSWWQSFGRRPRRWGENGNSSPLKTAGE